MAKKKKSYGPGDAAIGITKLGTTALTGHIVVGQIGVAAPASASRFAIAFPIPRVLPVIIATLPVRSIDTKKLCVVYLPNNPLTDSAVPTFCNVTSLLILLTRPLKTRPGPISTKVVTPSFIMYSTERCH